MLVAAKVSVEALSKVENIYKGAYWKWAFQGRPKKLVNKKVTGKKRKLNNKNKTNIEIKG